MDKCTHEVRAEYWRQIIAQCQSRPAGQTASQWLKENGIVEQTYYKWQRTLRQKAYDEAVVSSLPAIQDTNEVAFAEVKFAPTQCVSQVNISEATVHPVAIIKMNNNISIALTNDISETLLSRIMQEVTHA